MLLCFVIRTQPIFSKLRPRATPRKSATSTLLFSIDFATPTFQNTSPLFAKHRGCTAKKQNPSETQLSSRGPNLVLTRIPAHKPSSQQSPDSLPSQSFRSSCAPSPLHVQFAPSLQRARRLGPRFGSALWFGTIGDNEWLQSSSTVKTSISSCPIPNTPK